VLGPHEGGLILIGIAHAKTRYNHKLQRNQTKGGVTANQFVSRFCAMRTADPYAILARTLFSAPNEMGGNPYKRLQLDPLEILERFDQCPRIHFVSGMTLDASDPSKLIIAYGINNDCVPRLAVVKRKSWTCYLHPSEGCDTLHATKFLLGLFLRV
jgi:hypothetical protein